MNKLIKSGALIAVCVSAALLSGCRITFIDQTTAGNPPPQPRPVPVEQHTRITQQHAGTNPGYSPPPPHSLPHKPDGGNSYDGSIGTPPPQEQPQILPMPHQPEPQPQPAPQPAPKPAPAPQPAPAPKPAPAPEVAPLPMPTPAMPDASTGGGNSFN